MTAELGNLKGYDVTKSVVQFSNALCIDPFADTDDNDGSGAGIQEGLIHIRIQQRNGRKTLTTVQGIHPKFDLKKLVKVCKKEFNCNGTVVEHPEYGEVIQLQGDKRDAMKNFLVKVGMASSELVKVHGF